MPSNPKVDVEESSSLWSATIPICAQQTPGPKLRSLALRVAFTKIVDSIDDQTGVSRGSIDGEGKDACRITSEGLIKNIEVLRNYSPISGHITVPREQWEGQRSAGQA
jgi:hypothetical protein